MINSVLTKKIEKQGTLFLSTQTRPSHGRILMLMTFFYTNNFVLINTILNWNSIWKEKQYYERLIFLGLNELFPTYNS